MKSINDKSEQLSGRPGICKGTVWKLECDAVVMTGISQSFAYQTKSAESAAWIECGFLPRVFVDKKSCIEVQVVSDQDCTVEPL